MSPPARARLLARPLLPLLALLAVPGAGRAQDDVDPRLADFMFPPAPGEVLVETVVEEPGFPVAMVFLPDGTLLYTDKDAQQVRVVTPAGERLDEPFLDLSGEEPSARGLIGIALDPDFERNGFVYLSLSSNLEAPVDRDDIARIVRVRAEGRRAAADSLTTLVVVPGQPLVGYEGGNLHFGPDGQLYLVIGDRRPDGAPQDPAHVAGQMLRYTPQGGIPADNPFGAENPSFALGLRNSFDFCFDPRTGGLFATDNGPAADDEINLVEAGLNYGWPVVNGPADEPDEQVFAARDEYRGPLLVTGPAPTGIVVDEDGVFGLAGALLVVEWTHGRLLQLELDAERRRVTHTRLLSDGIGTGVNDLTWGPDGRLYACSPAAIRRLSHRHADAPSPGD